MRTLILSILAIAAGVTPVMAQQGDNIATIPAISIASRGEVKVSPDRASIQIAVQTKGQTAAAAAAENATKQKAVIAALRSLGLDDKDVSTSGYNVYPEQRYEANKDPIIIGYNVTNTLTVDLKSVNFVGRVIDAALGNGANMINSLQFYASNVEAARREAIGAAVRKARADAEAAAKAAGGAVGDLLELSIGAYYPPQPRPMIAMKAQAAADTPIVGGDETVAVDVTTRWKFVK
jgi:uncharacterized protein YggE